MEEQRERAIRRSYLALLYFEVLLNEGRAAGNKQLKDHLEVTGYAEAARWVYAQARGRNRRKSGKLLNVTEVRHVHRLAMLPVWEVAPHPNAFDSERPGNWRQHDIRLSAHRMTPPEHPQVPALVHDWVDEVVALRHDPAPIAEAVAVRHAVFERIHPFLDGNGRVGRLLMNLVLVRLGYPPAIIQKRERERCLEAVANADRGDPGPLGELIARAILDNLTRFILPAVAGPTKLLPLDSLTIQDLSVVALRYAAMRGRLKAIKAADGSWRSSKQWVEEYRLSRYSGLRKPRKPSRAHEAAASRADPDEQASASRSDKRR